MLKVFVQKSHVSCKKLLNWLDEQGFEYEARYIDKEPLSLKELLSVLKFTENGFEDILSYRSLQSHLKLTDRDIETLSIKELGILMVENPSLIKKPIVIRGEKIIVGYDKTQVYTLIPKEIRSRQRKKLYNQS